MSNRLQYETSPYLLQHKNNPVDWYPWCKEAFERAKSENKPIFLSIGYSTCHWCHVLAHESFEDNEIAEILNRYFISIKVDKEERPDIDNVFMTFCQAFTGSGGWPLSIFMTAEQKPFFAGTYFPKTSSSGMIGMRELLLTIKDKWINEHDAILKHSDDIAAELKKPKTSLKHSDSNLPHTAADLYKKMYDSKFGGFGRAPKFPTPHNILFLLSYYDRYGDIECLQIAEHTLQQMYRGGMFDHIGFGFCRYSTDNRFLVPHFEKMLYDNALLILAYCKAYTVTKKPIYLSIAEKTAEYILREMTSHDGAFYCAQDADSDGEEGKYYLFTPYEIINLLGKEYGESFCHHYDITGTGNFEGKSIPNLLKSPPTSQFDIQLPLIREFRKKRYNLHLDDKVLTSWNSLMIAAMCELFIVSGKKKYLDAAERADSFIKNKLYKNNTLYVSYRDEKIGVPGFLDDYAGYIFAKLALYRATLSYDHITCAVELSNKVLKNFSDITGGFFLYEENSEELILRPKECYDGAIPSGNSLMAYNLVRLTQITNDVNIETNARLQLDYLMGEASNYPSGHAMFLTALLEYRVPPTKITAVLDGKINKNVLLDILPVDAVIIVEDKPSKEYPLINGKPTYYICKGYQCYPPTNDFTQYL